MEELQLIQMITEYYHLNIIQKHKTNTINNNSKLRNYKINPFIVKYLSKVLEDDFTPIGIAKALYYPRVLGTSINTSFGTQIQKMFIELNLASGSLIPEMDIEFIDKIDNRKKWCQLKSGPNNINKGDVNPLLKKFSTVANLARTNYVDLNNTDLMLGVLYGEESQLSQHYRRIDETYPVIIGTEFWYRLTGFQNFYQNLVSNLDTLILNIDTENFFEQGYLLLAEEIKDSELFDFT